MPQQNVFSWKEGSGWLVFSGGNEPIGEIRATAIERNSADGALACVILDDPALSDAILEDMQELGAPSGYLVNAMTEDDDTIRKQIGDAGIIVLSSDAPPHTVRSNVLGAVLEGLVIAYNNGALILAENNAAAIFGAHFFDGETITNGLDWLHHGFIAPGMISAAASPEARTMIAAQPEVVVVGINVGAALVLGGNGLVETWGNKQITIALGSAYTDE